VLASTANPLKTNGWRAGAPFGEGAANFEVMKEWNPVSVPQNPDSLCRAACGTLRRSVEFIAAIPGALNQTGRAFSALNLEISGREEIYFSHVGRAYGLRCRDLVDRWSSALASTPKAFASLSTMSIVALYSERSSALT
jgi:hypothetical protein